VNGATLILAIQFAAAGALAALIFMRRIHRTLPLFSSYVIYSSAAIALQLACASHPQLYFKVYWLTEAGDVILAVAATCESFIFTFRGFFVLSKFRWLLPSLAFLIACYTVWKAWAHPPALNGPLVAVVVGLEFGLRYFIAAIFIVYAAARRYTKIQDVTLQRDVILGFFLGSAGMLIAAVVRSEFGTNFSIVSQWAAPVGYSIALFVWLHSLVILAPGAEPKVKSQINAASAIQELTQYSSVVKKARQ
jgi:hypothetical protein